jgi:hypothetical protein
VDTEVLQLVSGLHHDSATSAFAGWGIRQAAGWNNSAGMPGFATAAQDILRVEWDTWKEKDGFRNED